ncbi:MAG: hypothetical protein KJ559_00145, partial [Nanoarchaeota archaeon]|nr:hypothetical protein [Nanoarchaeota archaeon]
QSLSLSDNISRIWTATKKLTEIQNLSDSFIRSINKKLTENINLSEEAIKSISRIISESLSISDGDIYSIIKLLTESLNLSDYLEAKIPAIFKELSESYNLSDAQVISIIRKLIENYSLSDNFSRTWSLTREFTDTANLSDLESMALLRNLSESNNLNDSKLFSITKALTESQGLSDSILRNIARLFSEEFSFTDYFEKVKTMYKELTESITLDDGTMEWTFVYPVLLIESFGISDKIIQATYDRFALSTARKDIQDIIINNGIPAILIRQTKTVKSMGDATNITGAEYAIYVQIQDILKEDRKIHDMGLAFPGTAKAFFFHKYPDSITGNGDVIVQVGDMIKDDEDKYWRIEKINSEKEMQGDEIFKNAMIKRIGLDQ